MSFFPDYFCPCATLFLVLCLHLVFEHRRSHCAQMHTPGQRFKVLNPSQMHASAEFINRQFSHSFQGTRNVSGALLHDSTGSVFKGTAWNPPTLPCRACAVCSLPHERPIMKDRVLSNRAIAFIPSCKQTVEATRS